MYPKTEKHELSQAFLLQISLLTLLALAVIVFFTRYLVAEKSSADPQTMLLPWLIAAGHTIESALGAFSGKSPKNVEIYEVVRGLTALLISGVICPTVFLFGWRRRRLPHISVEEHRPLTLSVVLFGLCAAMVLYVAVAMLPTAASSEMVRASVRAAQGVQSNRDSVINEINTVAINARQHYILPKELGGGGRSYEGFVLPQDMSKTAAARYAVVPAGKEMMIRAASVAFEDCSVVVRLDSTGRLWTWNYAGRFR